MYYPDADHCIFYIQYFHINHTSFQTPLHFSTHILLALTFAAADFTIIRYISQIIILHVAYFVLILLRFADFYISILILKAPGC